MVGSTDKRICPKTGLEITESDHWKHLKLAENYIISFRKIGDHIVDVHGHGNVADFDAVKFQNFLQRFVMEMKIQTPYVEMRNYEDLAGMLPTRETMQIQKDYFIQERDRRIGFVAYNTSKAIGMLLKSGQRQYKKYDVELQTATDYEQAVTIALRILNKRYKRGTEQTRIRPYKIRFEEIDKVATFCGSLLWEEDIIVDFNELIFESNHPLYPIVENLMILKEELLLLQADSNKKTKALDLEKQQTEKIVESLQSGIVIVDRKTGMVVDSNPAACQLFHLDKESVVGMAFSSLVKDRMVDYSGMGKGNQGIESEIVIPDGRSIPIMRSSVKIKLGGKDYILENLVDMSDAKEHEEQLMKSLAHTKQLNNLTFNREKRIIDMKTEVNDLLQELGRPPKYKSVVNLKKE